MTHWMAGAASAQTFSLTNQVLELDGVATGGVDVESAGSGHAWRYTLGYAVAGAPNATFTVTAELPDGMWALSSVAPDGMVGGCTKDPTNSWKWACEWSGTAPSNGVAGAISLEVRNRPWFWADGSTVTVTAAMEATYEGSNGPVVATRSAVHDMKISATPVWKMDEAVYNPVTTYSQALHNYTVGPDGKQGWSFYLRIYGPDSGSAIVNPGAKLFLDLPAGVRWRGFSTTADKASTPAEWATGTVTVTFLKQWATATGIRPDGTAITSIPVGNSNYIHLWVDCSADRSAPVTLRTAGTYPYVDANGALQVGTYPESTFNVSIAGGECTATSAYVVKTTQNQPNIFPNVEYNWRLFVRPTPGVTQHTDAVIWDEIPADMTYLSYRRSINGQVNYGQFSPGTATHTSQPEFTPYFCDLSSVSDLASLSDAEVRARFLSTWKDSATYCTTVDPGLAPAVTHVFFYAPTWGPSGAPLAVGDFIESFFAILTTRANAGTTASPLPANGASVTNTLYFGDAAMALEDPPRVIAKAASVEVDNRAAVQVYASYQFGEGIDVGDPNVYPGLVKAQRIGLASNLGSAVNPAIECRFPLGTTVVGPLTHEWNCQAPNPAPAPWPAYTTTIQQDGSTVLRQETAASGDYVSQCNGWQGTQYHDFQVAIDTSTVFTDMQVLPITCTATADNDATPHIATAEYIVRVPAEMTLSVLPSCDTVGQIGFSALFNNTGGQPLNGVIVEIPIAETTDPGGSPFDAIELVSAEALDLAGQPLSDAVVEYLVSGTWQQASPTPASAATSVRVRLTAALPPHSGARRLSVKIKEAAGNPGNRVIYASGSMVASELSQISSLDNVPFTVGSCPALVTVHKFMDLDEDAQQTSGEVDLNLWHFEVRDGSAVVATLTTDATGHATVSLPAAGTYSIAELLPVDASGRTWRATTPWGAPGVAQPLTFGAAGGTFTLEFGNTCDCDDGNPCTDDVCTLAGCSYVAVANGPVDADADACAGIDTCVDGAFVSGTPLGEGASCDDGDLCTTSDSCSGGECIGTAVVCAPPSDLCIDVSSGACEPTTGACTFDPVVCAENATWAYGIVEDANGAAIGSVRCEVTATTITCDHDSNNVLTVHSTLWCPEGDQP